MEDQQEELQKKLQLVVHLDIKWLDVQDGICIIVSVQCLLELMIFVMHEQLVILCMPLLFGLYILFLQFNHLPSLETIHCIVPFL